MSRELAIADYKISDDTDPFVIAEIGANHQGDVNLCESMFEAASKAGAHAVKLQKRENRLLFMPSLFNQPYIGPTSFAPTYGLHREFLEFNLKQYVHMQNFAKKLGLVFFATATDKKSIDFLMDLKVPALKMASADLYSTPLLRYASKFKVPLILSTGGSDQFDVDRAMKLLNPKMVGLLQCTATYPADAKDMNLNVIATFRDRYPDTVIGLSSHDRGISFPVIAAALGARIIEKHFTLDRSLKGTDHSFSLEPSGMERMCRDLKNVKLALGNPNKTKIEAELSIIKKFGKMIVYSRNLKTGTVLQEEDLEIRAPLEGIPAYRWDEIIGKKLKQDVQSLTQVSFNHLDS
jgi:sialic acid synthase